MPLDVMLAVTLARPDLAAGSRRAPASKSTCTSTIGMPWLSTRKTLAPLARLHCWIGMAAMAACEEAMARASAARACRTFSFIAIMSLVPD